jgi:hypothetical protein
MGGRKADGVVECKSERLVHLNISQVRVCARLDQKTNIFTTFAIVEQGLLKIVHEREEQAARCVRCGLTGRTSYPFSYQT